jgi:hypothetical protein
MSDAAFASMDVEPARQLGRQVKAALLHLAAAEDIADAAGVDLISPVSPDPGPAPLFRTARDAVEDLDLWTINNAGSNGAGRATYVRTQQWCQTPGGILPVGGQVATSRPVTAARMHGLAGLAEDLAAAIEAARADLRALYADYEHPVRRRAFRLEMAAGEARHVADELHQTGSDLERIEAVPDGACELRWGVCPEHGATLTGTGGTCRCQIPECGRSWDYDRMDLPCAEPARWRVTDQYGHGGVMCDGHARNAREALVDATVVPLRPTGQEPS